MEENINKTSTTNLSRHNFTSPKNIENMPTLASSVVIWKHSCWFYSTKNQQSAAKNTNPFIKCVQRKEYRHKKCCSPPGVASVRKRNGNCTHRSCVFQKQNKRRPPLKKMPPLWLHKAKYLTIFRAYVGARGHWMYARSSAPECNVLK